MHYERATEAAWEAIREKLELIRRRLGIESVELVGVRYDRDSAVSIIDELPDEPKSPHPEHVEIRVVLEVNYRIVRQP